MLKVRSLIRDDIVKGKEERMAKIGKDKRSKDSGMQQVYFIKSTSGKR